MEEQVQNNAQEQSSVVQIKIKKPSKKQFGPILGMIAGILSVIFGVVVFSMSTGSWEPPKSYGGDAYSGIQQAAAQTANNVQELADICRCGFAYLLIVVGLITIAVFASKLSKKNAE